MPAIAWTTLAVTDLPVGKAAALVASLQTAALGDGQADPLPAILAGVVTRIRAEIAAGGCTVLDADPAKIPPSLKPLAMRMALREGQSRLNALGALPLSDDERMEWKEDIRFLERIAEGRITVESSTNPETTPTVQAASPSPQICAPERQWSAANQDGA